MLCGYQYTPPICIHQVGRMIQDIQDGMTQKKEKMFQFEKNVRNQKVPLKKYMFLN